MSEEKLSARYTLTVMIDWLAWGVGWGVGVDGWMDGWTWRGHGWTRDCAAAGRAALARDYASLLTPTHLTPYSLLLTLLKKIERITSSGVVFRKAIRLPQKTAHTPASL